MDAESKFFSRKLYDNLENAGASETNRKLNRHAATTAETLIKSYMLKDDVTAYICGSFSEGSVTPGIVTDVDVVICMNAPPVVFDINDKKPGISYLAEQAVHPGYVKLRLLKDGNAATKKEIDDRDHVNFRSVDDEAMYLKHISKDAHMFTRARIDGPAIALDGWHKEHLFDLVPAIKSEIIPSYANEWTTRIKSSGWLSEKQVDTMEHMGCMFVGIGFPDHEDSEIEWRLSFVLQERFLMSCLNEVQLKVYILLKIFKTHIFDHEKKEGSISSYDCKSCLLHVVETSPSSIWSKENLIECLERCLRYLSDRLKSEKCTNIFVDEQNLFDRDRIRKSKKWLIEKLNEFFKMNPSSLFEHVTKVIHGMEMTSTDIKIYHFKIKQALIGVFVLVRDLLLYQIRPASYESLGALLQYIEQSTDDNLKTASAYVMPWIELRVGMCLAANAVSNKSNGAFDNQQLANAFEHIQKGLEADLLNVPLAKASILFQLQRYQECLDILQDAENCTTENTVNACFCDMSSKVAEAPDSLQINYETAVSREWGDKGINEIRKNMFAGCFCFLPSEETLVPKPLLYEMKLCKNENKGTIYDYCRSWVMVDAMVYLYTLFYLVGEATANREIQNDAIKKLTKILQHNDQLRHKEVGYNILGWIMIQEKKYLAAVRYFLKSWKLPPKNNAAKYHIQELFGRLDEDGKHTDKQKRLMLQVICSALQLLPE